MPLTKAKGNMYGWVTHTHSHLAGKCPHECSYCYVQAMERRFGKGRYDGPLRLVESELQVNYGRGKKIFVEHCNDLFAIGVQRPWIAQMLEHCRKFPENEYVFQTKNPARILGGQWQRDFPANTTIGCTIESNILNRVICGDTPLMIQRANAMRDLAAGGFHTFITIEPIMKFDLSVFVGLLCHAHPEFINIGADSKGGNLPEPSKEAVLALVCELRRLGYTVNLKPNLERIVGKDGMVA